MSHSIPIELNGGAAPAPVTQPVPLAPAKAAAPITSLTQAIATISRRPTYANSPGEEWSTRELQLTEQALRTGGLEAAYKVVPHRSKAAVRGRLQRAGLIPARAAAEAARGAAMRQEP